MVVTEVNGVYCCGVEMVVVVERVDDDDASLACHKCTHIDVSQRKRKIFPHDSI